MTHHGTPHEHKRNHLAQPHCVPIIWVPRMCKTITCKACHHDRACPWHKHHGAMHTMHTPCTLCDACTPYEYAVYTTHASSACITRRRARQRGSYPRPWHDPHKPDDSLLKRAALLGCCCCLPRGALSALIGCTGTQHLRAYRHQHHHRHHHPSHTRHPRAAYTHKNTTATLAG